MDEKVIEEMARAIDDACVAWQKHTNTFLLSGGRSRRSNG